MFWIPKSVKKFDWKYSLREILLIVVGILIALGINNWNEQRKLYNKETKTLHELKAALQNDLVDIKINKRIHDSSLRSTRLLIDHLKAEKSYHDSLDTHFGVALGSTFFLSDDAAYSSLGNKGRELVSNDSIRATLSVLYAHDYGFIKQIEKLDNKTISEIFMPYYSEHFRDFRLFESATPIDYEYLLKDSRYVGYLEWWISNRLHTTSRYDLIQNKVL